MFYHVGVSITGVTKYLYKNLTKEQVLNEFLCPFINKEITLLNNQIFNMSSCGGMRVYLTNNPIDSDWPIDKRAHSEKYKDPDAANLFYHYEAINKLQENEDFEISEKMFKEALVYITNGEYKNFKESIIASLQSKTVFIICEFGNDEINHNYEFVIKPLIEKYALEPIRIDFLSHTGHITEKILEVIRNSHFVIADLTGEKQNCYYELGYAHALGKRAIILAKEGTKRHFDISTYKWNYWSDYKDLKIKLEAEIKALLND